MNKVYPSDKSVRRMREFVFPERFFRMSVVGLDPIPAYFFHQICVIQFGEICRFCALNSVDTVTFSDILDRRVSGLASVAITMDDGWSSVWSVAFPLARRHGLRFTLFVNPDFLLDSDECRTTMDDGVEPAELMERDRGLECFLTWGEVNAMFRSGIVDVQSHSMHHGMVFSSSSPVNVVTSKGPFPMPGRIPIVLREGGVDRVVQAPPVGTPLYEMGPALGVGRRFVEADLIRSDCISRATCFGRGQGSTDADDAEMVDEILKVAKRGKLGRWENDEERRARFYADLSQAKRVLEDRVPGARVRAFAPPWGVIHEDVPEVAKAVGYEVIVMAYPFPSGLRTSLPLYPRLFGDSIWVRLKGGIAGVPQWWVARGANRKRRMAGALP